MRLQVAYRRGRQGIAHLSAGNFSSNSETGLPGRATMSFSIAIKRRRCREGYEWVVDWFDPRRAARFEATFSTRAKAWACAVTHD
jgi:hypothetical protein